jgi:hypothetical protein
LSTCSEQQQQQQPGEDLQHHQQQQQQQQQLALVPQLPHSIAIPTSELAAANDCHSRSTSSSNSSTFSDALSEESVAWLPHAPTMHIPTSKFAPVPFSQSSSGVFVVRAPQLLQHQQQQQHSEEELVFIPTQGPPTLEELKQAAHREAAKVAAQAAARQAKLAAMAADEAALKAMPAWRGSRLTLKSLKQQQHQQPAAAARATPFVVTNAPLHQRRFDALKSPPSLLGLAQQMYNQ